MVKKMIILNEKEYAEECLKNKFIGDKPFYTLSVLGKYYYHCLGYRKKKIVELLTEFISSTYPMYECNKISWDESIDKISSKAGKYTLHEIDGVWITENELATIDNINSKVLRRLAFTLLCLAKLANIKNPKNSGWVNNDTKEIFKLARISCNVVDRDMYLCELQSLSLIEFPRKLDNLSCRIKYIDEDNDKALFISDFRELGYEYLKYCGENLTRCCECGILFKNNKYGNKKYCKDCSGYTPQKTKTVKCIDCGTEFEVSSLNTKTTRCECCKREYRRNYQKELMRKIRKMG